MKFGMLHLFENPDERTEHEIVKDQLDIILNPKRKKNYPNIKKRFLAKFKEHKVLPSKRKDLAKDQLAWWKTNIMAQAGKPKGFAHIGGNAQDISVKNLDTSGKTELKKKLEKAKFKIFMEFVTSSTSIYGVDIKKANVFHVYK